MKYHYGAILFLIAVVSCHALVEPGLESGSYLSMPILENPANGDSLDTNAPVLSWREANEALFYQIQINESEDFSSPLIDDQTASPRYVPGGLPPDSKIYWKVRAGGPDSVMGPWSEPWEFRTPADSGEANPVQAELESPSDGAEIQDTGVQLNWNQVAGAKGYRVQLSFESGFNTLEMDTVVSSDAYNLTGLDHDRTYYWRIRPEIEEVPSLWSATRSFTTRPPQSDPEPEPDPDPNPDPNPNPNPGPDPNPNPDPDPNPNPDPDPSPSSDMWVSAYLASYNHYVEPTGNWGNLPTSEISWDSFTHLFYFSLNARTDGSLSQIAPYQNISPDRIREIVSAAHNNGKRVLITIGGWGNYNGFSSAIQPTARPVFIANLVSLITTWGFDGIDLDMEPINPGDRDNYIALVKELHAALSALSTPLEDRPLLTAATSWHPDLFAEIHGYFDQINLMTYDLSGPWSGWVSWHNSPVYSANLTFPDDPRPLPSIQTHVNAFQDAGVPASKLGIGIDFYGYIWSGGNGTETGGVTSPNQSWSSPPEVTDNVPYHEIMDEYYRPDRYQWDSFAQAAYLQIDQPGDSLDKFISFDNEESIKAKINFIRDHNLGGTIIWELSGGYRNSQPPGSRNSLLEAVRDAVW